MMGLFASLTRRNTGLSGNGLSLRAPQTEHYHQWKALRAQSADFLMPWEPKWPDDDLTRNGYRRRLRRYDRDREAGIGLTWFIFRTSDNALLGGLTFTNIRFGAARSAQLGYWMGQEHAGQGHMKRAVTLALSDVFFGMGLERVEAACIAKNERSKRLLARLGFQREGYLRQYLEINGERQDHYLYAILRQDFKQNAPSENKRPVSAIAG